MNTGDNDRRHRGYHTAAHAAHRSILEQHRELRRLLALGLVQTCALSGGHQLAPAALRALAGQIRTVLFAHLSYEEGALRPLFDDERLGGTRRTQIMCEQHARQRREMETLHASSEAGDADAFADLFDRLARALLVDIAEEERQVARAVAILDDSAAPGCDGVRRPIVQARYHGSRARKVALTATG